MEPQAPDADPTIAALLAAAARTTTASVDGVSATVNGTGMVVAIQLTNPDLLPGPAGTAAAQALTTAWTEARQAVHADVRAAPGLSPRVRAALDGQAVPEDEATSREEPRAWTATSAGATVTFDARSQRFQEVYLADLDDASLHAAVTAANRALTLAETGGQESTPLDEQLDAHLERLDERMEAIEGRLDGVLDSLDRLERNLG